MKKKIDFQQSCGLSISKSLMTLFLVAMSLTGWSQATLPLSRTAWGTTPTGWTDNAGGNYATTFACSTNDGGKFATTADNYIVNFSSQAGTVSFTTKATATPTGCSLLLQESSNGSTWTTVSGTITLSTSCTSYGPFTLLSTSRYVKWTYTKSGSVNLTIDDVSITSGCTTPTVSISGTTPGCGSITLTASGTSGNTYVWSNSGGSTSTATYSSSGTYSVTATNSGCTASASKAIVVNSNPTLSISGTTTACGIVSLTASGTGTSYVWSGGSSTNTAANTFSSTGTYTVTSTLGSCTATASQSITVNPNPTLSISGTTPGCTSVTLTASGTGTGYAWSAGGGSSASATYSGSGTYTVTSTLGTCTATASQAINVNTSTTTIAPTPTQNITAGVNGNTLTVTEGTSAPTSRQWYYSTASGGPYGNTISGATSTTYTPNFGSAGTYYVVCQTTYGAPCSNTVTSNEVQINVTNNSITTGTVPGSPFCQGVSGISVPFTYSASSAFPTATFTAQLSDAAGSFASPTALQSIVSDGSGSQSISVTIPSGASAGTAYRIRVVSNTPAVSGSDNGTDLTIRVNPTLSISGTTTACASVSLTASGTGSSYVWSGGTSTTTAANTFTSSGTYTVTSTLSGCTATASSAVTVNTNPTVSISGTTPGCSSVTLTASGTGTSYAWSGGGGSSASANYSSSGTYTVTSTLGSCTATASQAITIVAAPSISAQPSTSAQTVCAGTAFSPASVSVTASNAVGYQWYVNTANNNTTGTLITGATGSSYTLPATVGTYYYYCIVTGNSPCTTVTSNPSGAITVNALPADPTGTISASANPSCGAATLSYSAPSSGIYWETAAGGTSTTYATSTGYSLAATGTIYARAYNGTCWSANTVNSGSITINTAINITAAPTSATVTAGGSKTFTVAASGTIGGYQWQYNDGTGWASLSNGSPYSGVTTASLVINPTATTMSGYQYRCVVSGTTPCTAATSGSATLTVNPAVWEDFEAGSKTAYSAANVTCTAGSWNFSNALLGTSASDLMNGSQSARVNSAGLIKMNFDLTTGLGTVTVSHGMYGSDASATWRLEASTDGGSTFTAFVSSTYTAPAGSFSTQVITVNLTGNVRFRIVNLAASGNNRINFDDIYVTPNTCTQPTITGTTPASTTCGSGTVTLGATASAGTVNWYTASSGGTAIATGNSYSPTISSTTTYYVDATNAGCTTSGRTAVVATLTTQPTTPACATPAAICAGSTATITGAGSTGATAYTYWTASTGGSAVTTGTTPAGTVSGNNLTTPSSLAAGSYTYFVQGENGSCLSATRQSVTVTVNSVPSTPTGTISVASNPACGSTTLTYSAPSASLYWETAASGTSTASPTTTAYTLSSSGTMYVRAINSGCPSAGAVSSASVTVNTNTSITTQPANTTVSVGSPATFSVTAAGVGLTYQWRKGGVNISGATSSSYTLSSAALTDDGSIYSVVVTGTCGTVTSSNATLTVLNFVYRAGDYRSVSSSTTLAANNTAGTTNNWEYYNGTTWGTTPGDKAPANATTTPTRVIIAPGTYVNGAGNDSKAYHTIVVQSNGWLDLRATGTPSVDFIPSGDSLEVLNGGYLSLWGQISINSGAKFILRKGSIFDIESPYIDNRHVIWGGIENFEPGSEFYVGDWAISGSGSGSLYNTGTYPSGNISNNANGYKFGILSIDVDLAYYGTDWTLVGGSSTVKLCDTLNVDNTSNLTYAVSMMSHTSSPTVTVGRLNHNSGYLALAACFSGSATQTLNITENLSSKGNGALTLFHNGGGSATNATVNLTGDLTVASTVLFDNEAATGTSSFNYNNTSTTQYLDVATQPVTIPMNILSGANVALRNNNLDVTCYSGTSAAITVKTGGTLDFGFAANNTTALVIKKSISGGTNTFVTEQGSTLKITSPDGIQQLSGTLGNVQFTNSNKTFNQLATFWYTGHANQVTGDAITTSSNGKQIIIDLLNKSLSVTLTQSTGLTNATTISATGGKLDIRKGQFLETATAYITGSTGTLTMAAGTLYQIPALSTSSSDLIPRMDGVSNAYTLNGGTIELAGAGAQTLRGNRTYYNVKFSGSNIYGTDYKNLSTDATINDSLIVSSANTVVNCVDGSGGAVSFLGNGGLIMDGGRIMIRNLSTTQPVLTGTTIPYSLTGGTVEFYGSNGTAHQVLRGTDGNSNTISYYNVDINADAANTTDYNVGPAASFAVKGNFNVYSPAVFQLDETENVTGTGNFAINAGATFKYGSPNGIKTSGTTTSDGNIRISGTRTFSSSASYGFVGNGDMVSGNGLPSSMVNIYVQKSGTSDIVTLTNTANASGVIAFTKGRISTGSNELVASSTSTSAITGHGLNKYVIGNLRRYVGASGAYDFPVGNTSYYDLGNISFNGQSGITSLLGYFTTGQSGTAPSISTCQINGSKINDYLNNGFWTFTPNSTMAGGTYDVTLNAMGYSNAPTAANQMGVIKRSNASFPWLGCGLLNGSAQSSAYGSHSNATQSISGGVATAVRTGVTGFSDFAIGLHQTNTPLPVTLMYLTATVQDDRYIILEWATASEINNSGFQVERSTDGIAFEPIAWVDGSGNSNSMIKYATDDRQVATGTIYYYRLKQVDYDGKYEYSNIVSASLTGSNNGITIHNIYPNPAAAQVTVDIVAATETPVAISFTDVLGREVLSTQWQLRAGYNDRRFDIAALADGVYHVTVKTGNSFFTKVLTIAK
ncbi:MAG: T9SS type A sorting domain-containing protein [Bacteroidetes bacterium]|nr:T9SS type A sorting domain-containing protein [Bacteroidota bacterium]